MSARLAAVAFALCLLPASGWAQDDDLLAPLTPGQKQPKVKRKRPPRPRAGEDLLAPLSAPAELLVTLEGGISGARLFVDDKDLGAVTGQPVPLPGGEHRVVIRRIGFADFGVMVKLDQGEHEELEVTLEPVAGVMTIQANVPGAEVMIDGKGVGRAPLREVLVPPGLHEIRVEKDGYLAEVTKITIRGGKDYNFNSLLTPRQGMASSDRPQNPKLTPANPLGGARIAPGPAPQPAADAAPAWYGQWYVWAGAAALVGAAAGGTYYAVQTQRGFTPDQVCSPSSCVDVVNYQGLRARRAPQRAILIPPIAF